MDNRHVNVETGFNVKAKYDSFHTLGMTKSILSLKTEGSLATVTVEPFVDTRIANSVSYYDGAQVLNIGFISEDVLLQRVRTLKPDGTTVGTSWLLTDKQGNEMDHRGVLEGA